MTIDDEMTTDDMVMIDVKLTEGDHDLLCEDEGWKQHTPVQQNRRSHLENLSVFAQLSPHIHHHFE